MTLLFDNNLSILLPEALAHFFPESKHIADLKLEHLTDKQIFDFARENQFTIVTKDKDFYHLLNTFGPPPKIVWLSIGNCSNKKVIEILTMNCKHIAEFIKSNRSLLVIDQR